MRLTPPVAAGLVVLLTLALSILAPPVQGWTDAPQPAPGILLAKSKKVKKTHAGKTIVEENEGETVAASSSEANREGKHWELVAELVGFSVFPLVSFGATAGYYLQPDMIMELNYAKGEADIIFLKVYSEVISARLKKFWGNSFYTNTGVGLRTLGASYTLSALTGSKTYDGKAEAKSLALDFAIGNMWQFQNFAIGCDWVGALVPLVKLTTTIDEPAGASPSDTKDAKDSFDKLALQGTAQLVRFYLGASF